MDLALHLGRPVEELLKTMTEAELHDWNRLSRRRGLPWQRIELLLAQLTLVIARSMGGAKNAKVADFMLTEVEEIPDNVTPIERARLAFGFNPRKRKA